MISNLLSFLLIAHLECYTQFGVCPEAYTVPSEFLLNRPIYYPLPRSDIFSRYKLFPEIRSISLHRRLPNTLVLDIEVRRPLGLLTSQILGAHTSAVVDETGLVFNGVDSSALPQLIISDSINLGGSISSNQLKAIKILNSISHLSPSRLTGQLTDSTLTITMSPLTTVLLDVNRLPDDWPAPLQSIFTRSKIDGKFSRKIDMRFSHPYEE